MNGSPANDANDSRDIELSVRSSRASLSAMRFLSRLFWCGYSSLHVLILVAGLMLPAYVFQIFRGAGVEAAFALLGSIFIGSSVIDAVLGQNRRSVPQADQSMVVKVSGLVLVPYLAVVIAMIGVTGACLVLGGTLWEAPGIFIASIGVTGLLNGAVGIVSAHELIHRRSWAARGFGLMMLSFSCYATFYREHLDGHHRDVATPDDPSSARLNESIYRFLPRAIVGNVRKAIALEKKAQRRQGWSFWSHRNPTLMFSLVSASILTLLVWIGSWQAGLFFLGQSLFAVITLETINYIQHYGLTRKQQQGGYEPVSPRHSFNSPFLFDNLTLLNLMRHSDHHAYAARPYAILRLAERVPLFPLPPVFMMVIAYLPPLWFVLMNPRVEAASR